MAQAEGKTYEEVVGDVVKKLYEMALAGDMGAIKEFLARAIGPIKQELEAAFRDETPGSAQAPEGEELKDYMTKLMRIATTHGLLKDGDSDNN